MMTCICNGNVDKNRGMSRRLIHRRGVLEDKSIDND